MAVWFAQADADRDGRLTLAELQADADRFFTTLDRDRSGEIDPQEMADYENNVAPEIKLYQPDQDPRPRNRQQKHDAKQAAKRRSDYAAPYGAGLYASLNIPEPVVSADLDPQPRRLARRAGDRRRQSLSRARYRAAGISPMTHWRNLPRRWLSTPAVRRPIRRDDERAHPAPPAGRR